MSATRYAHLLWVQLRASIATAMQYRADYLLGGLMSFYWLALSLVPLFILFNQRNTVAGWNMSSAFVVIGCFTVLRGVLDGAINPSLADVVERVRTGEFDFVLLKPVDSQFLVSTARFVPWKIIDILGGLAIMAIAFVRMGRTPAPADIALGAIMLLAAVLVLYSLWILVISASFYVIRLDNLAYLFSSLFDAARWPIQVFRGLWRFLFTFIVPLALMTTYPAMAVLGSLDARTAILSLAGALGFAVLARTLWRAAISSYTSASS